MSVLKDPSLPCRILVVDDSELSRSLTSAVLASLGEIDCVDSGDAALSALDARSYDLVLMDLDMPISDGHATTRAIRERPGWDRDTKIVALSAAREAGAREAGGYGAGPDERAGGEGLNGYLSRPISPRDLLGGVQRALSAAEAPIIWDRGEYQALVARLGEARMGDYLRHLRAYCVECQATAKPGAPVDDSSRRMAHDLCSTAGMMGFRALLRSCRSVLATPSEGAMPERFLADLVGAVSQIDSHFGVGAEAA